VLVSRKCVLTAATVPGRIYPADDSDTAYHTKTALSRTMVFLGGVHKSVGKEVMPREA
jgi:hypothetical protein